MNFKTWNPNKIQYGIVGNLSTMNHLLIMVCCKEANFLTLHYFIWCRLLVVLHPSTFECFCIPHLSHSNHKCKVFIAFQLSVHIERDGPHTPYNHAKKPKDVVRSYLNKCRCRNLRCVLQITLKIIPF
jgi:hypothetical protein